MKKILVLIICMIALSCSLGDDTPDNYQELLPVENVIIPEEFILNETYEISISYLRPTACHGFDDIYYRQEDNSRIVAVISTVFINNNNCSTLNTELEVTFNFKATQSGIYIFKFWQGKDDNGNDTYLNIEVPVVD